MALTKDPAGKVAPSGGFRTGGYYSGFHYWKGSFAPRAGQEHPESDSPTAGQTVSPEINRQTSVAAGLAPTANQDFVDAQNRRLAQAPQTTEDFAGFLNDFQQTIAGGEGPALRGGSVPVEFGAIRSRLEPSTRPEAFSRVAEFERLRGEFGVADLEEQLTNLKAQQQEQEAQLRINVAGERTKPVAQNVIDRRIGEHTRQSREDLEFVNRQQSYLTDQLNSAYQVINTYIQFGAADYQDAVNRYNSEFSQNLQLVQLGRDLKKDQISEQQRQIDNARATLSTFVNAITSGNLAPNQITADQRLLVRKLEVQSGLPIGFTESLQMSAQDQLVTISKDETQAILMDGNGNFRTVSTGARPATTASTATTAGERASVAQQDQRDEVDTFLSRNANNLGKVTPDIWNKGKQAWLNRGLDGGTFDSIYKHYQDERFVEGEGFISPEIGQTYD